MLRNGRGAVASLRWVAACISLLLLLRPAQTVSAHPADMYAQSESVSIGSDGIQIDWKIAPGPILADTVWETAGPDPNGSISPAAAEAWVTPFLADFSVLLDGKSLGKYEVRTIHWPATVDVLRTGEDSIGVSLHYSWPAGLAGTYALEIHNAHLEANSLNSFALAAEAGFSFDQPAQKSGLLGMHLHFPAAYGGATAAPSSALTSWSSGTPNLPDFTAAVSHLAVAISNPTQPQAQQPASPASSASSVTAALTGLVKTNQFSPLFLVGAFLLSLALGSLHALTPGHGKALVGAYLVGSQGRTRDAVFLGTVVTATHTGSVLLLGLVTLFASHYILPSLIAPWLEIVSGVLVIAFGLNLLFQRRRDLRSWLATRHAAREDDTDAHAGDHHDYHSGPGHEHTHDAAGLHYHPHADRQAHDHAHEDQARDRHAHTLPSGRVTFKSLLTLGISGGLVPCPDAIAILLVAVAVNRVPFGMLLIVSFSIGLALVLIAIGIAMVHGVRLIAHSDLLSRFAIYTPVLSAAVVMGLGGGLTFSALNSLKFAAVVSQPSSPQPVAAQPDPTAGPANPAFDLRTARVLYVAPDTTGWDQLYMQPLSGGAVQYTHEASGITDYVLSPDRKTIAYTVLTASGGSAILSLDADGGHRRELLNCPQSECDFPRWYPDGQKVAYERLDQISDTAVPRFSIWWLDLATGKTQPVFQDGAFASYAPGFSPDGQWLSYVSTGENALRLYNLRDGSSRSVPLGFHAPLPETWSPAGDALLFGSEAKKQDWAPLHVKIYSLASGQVTDLGATGGATDYSAAWSPDGQWIAIDRNLPTGGTQSSNQVWLVKPDGSQAHALLDEDGASYSSLNWSPDSSYLICSRYTLQPSGPTTGRFDTYIVDIRTGESKLLVAGADLSSFLP